MATWILEPGHTEAILLDDLERTGAIDYYRAAESTPSQAQQAAGVTRQV
jgi:hypothetical protein